MRSKVARAVADDSEDDDDYAAQKKKKKNDSDEDDDDLPSFAAVASTGSRSGTRTSLRKASAGSSTPASASASTAAPAPKPAPARRARPRPTASKAAATASQTVAKKALTAAEQEELRKIREKEREEDDFFTSKREFTFKTGGKQTALPLPKGRVAPASSSSKQPAKAKPAQKVVIDLDQDESSSSAENHSGSDSDSSETRAKRKRRKKSKTPVKLASPTKRAASSSSSSSSSDSDSDSSAQRRKKRLKAEKKGASKANGQTGADRKGKGRASNGVKDEPKDKERSLSPLAQADTFEVAHALQDIRRHRPSMGRRYNVSSDGEDLGQEAMDELGELVGADGTAGQGTSRSRSASHHRGDSMDPLGHSAHARTSMTPFADDHELTEEEKEAKYGPLTSIFVKMVHDPRIIITDQNRNGVKRYTAGMDIKVRSRENFENVFGRVSTEKGIERSNIVITYNGQRLYSVGTPHSLSILSSANFEAYPREVYEYVQQQRRDEKARELAQAKEHQLESIARGNMPGAQRSRAIDLDEADEDRMNGAAADGDDGNDSDVQIVPREGARLASLQPVEGANRRDERSVSLAAADTGNANAGPKEPALKVTIRGGPQQQLNLRVPLTKTISTLIKAYLKKFNFDMILSSKCKVFFDGEALSHDLKLEDAEIEDEDTLDIRVPSS